MRLDPALLQRLSRSRLLRATGGNGGVGERRSREKGPGLEFADYRTYEAGDDLRYLDLQHYARRCELNIRQYEVTRALAVTVLVDTSRSMAFGTPDKFARTQELAQLFGFVGLAGGDTAEITAIHKGRLDRSRRVGGIDRAPVLFSWVDGLAPGEEDFGDTFRRVASRLHSGTLLVAISDWWTGVDAAQLTALRASGSQLLAIHVIAPEEEDPELGSGGDLRLADAESGLELDMTIDQAALADYRREYQAWRSDLRQGFVRQGFQYASIRTDDDLGRTVEVDWRVQGIIT